MKSILLKAMKSAIPAYPTPETIVLQDRNIIQRRTAIISQHQSALLEKGCCRNRGMQRHDTWTKSNSGTCHRCHQMCCKTDIIQPRKACISRHQNVLLATVVAGACGDNSVRRFLLEPRTGSNLDMFHHCHQICCKAIT